jgi:Gluconate 2-dehydrogenase subunit 3
LPSDLQVTMLAQIENTPFFDNMRTLTAFGMFSMPSYGGNREQLGWQLLGFDDQHVFESPFGYYDRDYPGFVSDAVQP